MIERLSLGGASRTLLAAAAFSAQRGRARHGILSLLPADPAAAQRAARAGLALVPTGTLLPAAAGADIVHIHFWNSPALYTALTSDLPPMRVAVTCHVTGLSPPQILTQEATDFADAILATSPLTQQGVGESLRPKMFLASSPADFARLAALAPAPHSSFTIGYIGTIDFGKMHPRYVAMHAAIDIPDLRIIICGEGAASPVLAKQIEALGASDRFDLRGYVEDIAPVLARLDIFGYPLCKDN